MSLLVLLAVCPIWVKDSENPHWDTAGCIAYGTNHERRESAYRGSKF